ncbi:MAG: methyltransferase domain-containing protein [Sedimentisphaerales bacterium]|nr:methyltransferase domain-containing protein [Sedimentisphaerales bacterium]
MSKKKCHLCGNNVCTTLLDMGSRPIVHDYLDDPNQEEPTYPFQVLFCEHCGLIQLAEPIAPELLYSEYLCLSGWKHQPHMPRLVELIETHTSAHSRSRILEVGSNDGLFLDLLRTRGYANLTGIEPAWDAVTTARKKGLSTIHAYFDSTSSKEYIRRWGTCDLFISRQMLEHITDLVGFIQCMQQVLRVGGYVAIEIPDSRFNLDTPDYALWEEHVNYFTLETLQYWLALAGVEILHFEDTMFSGESLMVIGRYLGPKSIEPSIDYLPSLRQKAMRYRDLWPIFTEAFCAYLRTYRQSGKKIAVYGAGARLSCLLNFTGAGQYVEFIVDDHPGKQGKFLPGSRLAILPSEALERENIDLCLLAVNTECEEQVIAQHPDLGSSGGEFVSVLPPTERLPSFWKNLAHSSCSTLVEENG